MRAVYCKTRAPCAEVRRRMMPSVLGVQVHAQLHPLDDVHALVQTLTAGGKLGPYEMVASPGWGKCTGLATSGSTATSRSKSCTPPFWKPPSTSSATPAEAACLEWSGTPRKELSLIHISEPTRPY